VFACLMLCVDSIPIQISLQTHFEELLQQASHRKLWEVLLLDMSFFFILLLAQANLAIKTEQKKLYDDKEQEGAANNPLGPVHCIPLLYGMNIHLPEGCGGKEREET